jgi:AcrR family transcriptional regulator
MGLRQQKKLRIRARIIENAISLFRERGFDATRVRDIARPLELSDATFFNYFAAKDEVLTEWLRDRVADAVAEAARSRPDALRSVARGVARILAGQFAGDADFLSGAWHRVRQNAGSAPPQLVGLLERAQARGELRGDLAALQLGDLLVAGLLVSVGSWLALDPRDPSELPRRLQGAVDLVIDGGRKRNERVRAPAPGRARSAPRPTAGPE